MVNYYATNGGLTNNMIRAILILDTRSFKLVWWNHLTESEGLGDYKHWTRDPRTGDPRTRGPEDPRTGDPRTGDPRTRDPTI